MKVANESRQSGQEEEQTSSYRQQIEENSATIAHLQDELRARYGRAGTSTCSFQCREISTSWFLFHELECGHGPVLVKHATSSICASAIQIHVRTTNFVVHHLTLLESLA